MALDTKTVYALLFLGGGIIWGTQASGLESIALRLTAGTSVGSGLYQIICDRYRKPKEYDHKKYD